MEAAMFRLARYLPLAALAALAACAEPAPTEAGTDGAEARIAAPHGFTVMSRNLYIGANADAVIEAIASGGDVVEALGVALQTLQHTDFPARMAAIAEEIAAVKPAVLGVQEVYDLYVNLTALGMGDGEIQLDFLAALEAQLDARGLSYELVARNTVTDVTLAGGAVHLVDHDALLVDPARVQITGDPLTGVFQAEIPPELTGGLQLLTGYVAAPATVDGVPVLLVNTHPQSGAGEVYAQLRGYQALELLQVVGDAPRVIMTGDFNDEPGSPMYDSLASGGLTDVWGALRPKLPGFSCCQDPDLSNPASALDQRIDYVWTRGLAGPSGRLMGTTWLTSTHPADRIVAADGSLIWPSDHAGLVASLLVAADVE
jgi:hypothetical protein